MKKIQVNSNFDNKNVSDLIYYYYPNLNPNQLFKAFRKKDIRINNIKINKDSKVSAGDEVTIYIIDSILEGERKIPIVYEDDYILVVNKPESINVVDEDDTYTLTKALKKLYGNQIEPCHRIDRNTKGLVIFAKNQEALLEMQQLFKNHKIEKYYLARVSGIFNQKQAIVKSYLFKDSKKSMVYISDLPKDGYKEIVTEYSVLNEDKKNNSSILEVLLHTGRTHQIRAHLAHIGHPIIGDGKYGDNQINKKFERKSQDLYSYKLKFTLYDKEYEIQLPNYEKIFS